MSNSKKILSVILALIMALSSITIMPLSAAAAQVEAPAQSGDSPYSGLTLDPGKLYFDTDGTGWDMSTKNDKVAFYIFGGDFGTEANPTVPVQWGGKKLVGNAVTGETGVYEFDPAAKAGLSFTPGVQYKIIFVHTSGTVWNEQTYELYFTTDCFGKVAYGDGVIYENPADSSRSLQNAYWRGIDPEVNGPVLAITSSGNVVGSCVEQGKTKYDLFVDFISKSDSDDQGMTGLAIARSYTVESGIKTEQEMIDDIADGLGLSKEDVSRAFSETGVETTWSPDPEPQNDFTYSTPDSSSVTITGYLGHRTIVEIPEEIDGYTVTGIEKSAFASHETIRKIHIPDTVTEIGEEAFHCCYALQEINLPEQLKTINRDTFNGCSSLSKINLPDSLTLIGGGAFLSCSSLRSIDIPDSVTGIFTAAFAGCSSLKEIRLSDQITSLRREVFDRCAALNRIDIPNSVRSIGTFAFNGCTSLSEVNIPDSVTEIDWWAFKGCTSLAKVTIPDSVVSIGGNAFDTSRPLTIYGYEGSAAQTYADQYENITFVPLDTVTDESGITADVTSGVTLAVEDITGTIESSVIPEGETLVAAYDVNLVKNGEAVQPEHVVTVKIPCDDPDAKVYRQEDDGTLTDMKAVYRDGYLVFKTTHFSVYIVAAGADVDLAICGDADGNGEVTIMDVTCIQRYLVHDDPEGFNEAAADVDGDGSVTSLDATWIQRSMARIDVPYPIGEII